MSRSLGTLTLDLVARVGSFEQGMSKAERSAKKMDAQYKQLKRSIDPAYAAQERFTKAQAVLKRELDRGAISTEQYTADIDRLQAAMGVRAVRSSKNLGATMQAAGYQVGDFAVQVASGQSALVAFTQQGAQLAGFFGPGGAVLGAVLAIGGAVAGYFVRSMGEGEKATDALTAAVGRLDRVVEEQGGIRSLAEDIRTLAKESEDLARARIVTAMAAAEEAAKSAAREIRDAFDAATDTSGFSDLSDFFGTSGTVRFDAIEDFRKSMGLAGKEGESAARRIFNAFEAVDAAPTIENFRALRQVLADTANTAGSDGAAFKDVLDGLWESFDQAETTAERVEYLQKAIKDLSSVGSEAAGPIEEMIDALRVQSETLGLGTVEMIEYSRAADLREAADKGATEAQLAAIGVMYDKIAAHEQEAAAQKAATEAAKEAEQVQKDYRNLLSSLRTDEERLTDQLYERLDVLKAVGDQASQQDYSRAAVASIQDAPEFAGLAPEIGGALGELNKIDEAEDNLQDWYDRQVAMLKKNRQEKADLSEAWNAKEREIESKHQEELGKIEQARQTAQLVATKDTFSEMAEAAKVFAGEQSGIYKAMFAASKGFAIADSIISIQQGIAKAAKLDFPANLAAMATVAANTASIVSTIKGVQLDGQAHDGIMSVPEDGTWNLKKGERVTTAETSAKLDATLDDIRRNGGGNGITKVEVINQGGQPLEGSAQIDGETMRIILTAVQNQDRQDMHAGRGVWREAQQKYGWATKGAIG